MKPEKVTAVVFISVIIAFMMMSAYAFVSSEDSPGLEDCTSKKLPGYYRLVESARKYDDIMRWNMASVAGYIAARPGYSPVMRLYDGWLTNFVISCDVTHDAGAVKGLADFCAEKGIDFAYINFPHKVCKYEDKEISGILDFTNQNADRLLARLKESGVRAYDFRESLHIAGMRHHESFHVTDHHWKPTTGLWAAREVLKILHDDFGWAVNPDLLRPENFRYVIYPEWFLGSWGKKYTLARAKPDDFTMIYPKFGTRLHFEIPSQEVNLSGDFGVIYDMKQVDPKDYYSKNPYGAYIYGDNDLTRTENRNMTGGKRLLVVKASFSNCVVPFVALGVKYVDVVDVRYLKDGLRAFIELSRPDAVIVEYNSEIPGVTENWTASEAAKRTYKF